MGWRTDQARRLDALASAAPTLAEAQALQDRADRLRRRQPWEPRWRQPFLRN